MSTIFPVFRSASRRLSVPVILALFTVGLSGCPEKDPEPKASAPASEISREEVLKRFHELWYTAPNTWRSNTYLGIETQQNPMDIWITQEILFEVKPDFMIECGAWKGGSAALWATLLEQINPEAKVLSVDIEDKMQDARKLPIVKKRVEYFVASSTAPEIVEKITKRVKGKKVVILLDSDHAKSHVLDELRKYSPLVSVGSYIIVQDSNINGHPIIPGYYPQGGPWEAVEEFLKGNDSFQIDLNRERMLFTFSPNGYLKRVK